MAQQTGNPPIRPGDRVTVTIENAAVVSVDCPLDGSDKLVVQPQTTTGTGFQITVMPGTPGITVQVVAPAEIDDLHPGDVYRAVHTGELLVWQHVADRRGFSFVSSAAAYPTLFDVAEALRHVGPLDRVFEAPRPEEHDDEEPEDFIEVPRFDDDHEVHR